MRHSALSRRVWCHTALQNLQSVKKCSYPSKAHSQPKSIFRERSKTTSTSSETGKSPRGEAGCYGAGWHQYIAFVVTVQACAIALATLVWLLLTGSPEDTSTTSGRGSTSVGFGAVHVNYGVDGKIHRTVRIPRTGLLNVQIVRRGRGPTIRQR